MGVTRVLAWRGVKEGHSFSRFPARSPQTNFVFFRYASNGIGGHALHRRRELTRASRSSEHCRNQAGKAGLSSVSEWKPLRGAIPIDRLW